MNEHIRQERERRRRRTLRDTWMTKREIQSHSTPLASAWNKRHTKREAGDGGGGGRRRRRRRHPQRGDDTWFPTFFILPIYWISKSEKERRGNMRRWGSIKQYFAVALPELLMLRTERGKPQEFFKSETNIHVAGPLRTHFHQAEPCQQKARHHAAWLKNPPASSTIGVLPLLSKSLKPFLLLLLLLYLKEEFQFSLKYLMVFLLCSMSTTYV